MRIIITVQDKNEKKQGRILTLDYTFFYDGELLLLQGSAWKREVKDPEKVFDAIKGFFYGTCYEIINFQFHKK